MTGVEFLQWALPRLRLRPRGFRRPRRQVLRRIRERARDLGCADLAAYRARLEADPAEWEALDRCCRVTISRFFRDRALWERLDVRGRVWCAGCASGEEPYTVAILSPGVEIVATDADPAMLERARRGEYGPSSLKELPHDLRARAFDGGRIRDEYRRNVTWRREDIREAMPDGPFDLIFCRYLVFTYFAEDLQRELLPRLEERLAPGGELLLGRHERLP